MNIARQQLSGSTNHYYKPLRVMIIIILWQQDFVEWVYSSVDCHVAIVIINPCLMIHNTEYNKYTSESINTGS